MARRDFSKKEWLAIDKVTFIRKKWRKFRNIPFKMLFNKINPFYFTALNSRYLNLLRRESYKRPLIREIIRDSNVLASSALEKIMKKEINAVSK